jgi:BirA family biotin operon repressor/biotin-[acetyl-CoA-carboxylase] ligase
VTHAGTALAFSLVLRLIPQERAYFTRLAGLGALAVCDALQREYGLRAEIKWPNDILVSGRKLAGILVDAVWEDDQPAWAVIGIGLNITPGSVDPAALPPGELPLPATCLEAELGKPADQAGLLHSILERLLAWRPRLDSAGFMWAWEERLAYKDCRVQVLTPYGLSGLGGVEAEGLLIGLASDGGLRLLGEDGREQSLRVGDLHLRSIPPVGLTGE